MTARLTQEQEQAIRGRLDLLEENGTGVSEFDGTQAP